MLRIKNQVILQPGTHNDVVYCSHEIERAFDKLPFDKPLFVFWDFSKKTKDCVGYLENEEFKDGSIFADIILFDEVENKLKELVKANFPIGVAPKSIGTLENKSLINFEICSTGLVTNPSDKSLILKSNQLKRF